MAAYRASGYAEQIAAERVGRRPGRLGGLTHEPTTSEPVTVRGAARPVAPPRRRPRNTNYAGGNTSAKGTDIDPVTGERRSS